MSTEIERLHASAEELEKTADALAKDFHNAVCSANRLSEQLAAVTKERNAFARLIAEKQKEIDAGICELKVDRDPEYGGRFGGYGPWKGWRTGEECAAVIRGQGK